VLPPTPVVLPVLVVPVPIVPVVPVPMVPVPIVPPASVPEPVLIVPVPMVPPLIVPVVEPGVEVLPDIDALPRDVRPRLRDERLVEPVAVELLPVV
jgi:signal-induced proliferation-associated 1 like protein 3